MINRDEYNEVLVLKVLYDAVIKMVSYFIYIKIHTYKK